MKFFIFLSLVGTLFAFSQKIDTIIEHDDATVGLYTNSTGVQRTLHNSRRVQIWYFCDANRETKNCGFWSENDKKINEKNTVKVEKINEGSAKLTNFHFGDDGEYIYYPSSEDKDQADAETHFFFVVPGPPTTKKP